TRAAYPILPDEGQVTKHLGVAGATIESLVELTAEEYASYRLTASALADVRAQHSLFALARLNHSAFTPKAGAIVLGLNRHLLNFLASIRAFLDHSETALIRRYGKGSAEFDAFRLAKAREYDEHFAYRFLYALRNYAQHC